MAQRDLLRLEPGERVEGVDQGQLDSALAERQMCRSMIGQVNKVAELLDRSIQTGNRDALEGEIHNASLEWPSLRGFCDAAIGRLDDGWPRSVLRAEFESVQGLWLTLQTACVAWADGEAPDEVSARLANYAEQVQEWSAWLARSTRFWAGELGQTPLPSRCFDKVRAESRVLAERLWDASARMGTVDDSLIGELEIRLRAQRKGITACKTANEAEAYERHLIHRFLDTYEEALRGIREGDLPRLRRAMEQEQRVASRGARCRVEHAAGSPSSACQP